MQIQLYCSVAISYLRFNMFSRSGVNAVAKGNHGVARTTAVVLSGGLPVETT